MQSSTSRRSLSSEMSDGVRIRSPIFFEESAPLPRESSTSRQKKGRSRKKGCASLRAAGHGRAGQNFGSGTGRNKPESDSRKECRLWCTSKHTNFLLFVLFSLAPCRQAARPRQHLARGASPSRATTTTTSARLSLRSALVGQMAACYTRARNVVGECSDSSSRSSPPGPVKCLPGSSSPTKILANKKGE